MHVESKPAFSACLICSAARRYRSAGAASSRSRVKKPSLFELTEPLIEPFGTRTREDAGPDAFCPSYETRNRTNLPSYGSDALLRVSTRMFSHKSRSSLVCRNDVIENDHDRPHCDNSVAALESGHVCAANRTRLRKQNWLAPLLHAKMQTSPK